MTIEDPTWKLYIETLEERDQIVGFLNVCIDMYEARRDTESDAAESAMADLTDWLIAHEWRDPPAIRERLRRAEADRENLARWIESNVPDAQVYRDNNARSSWFVVT